MSDSNSYTQMVAVFTSMLPYFLVTGGLLIAMVLIRSMLRPSYGGWDTVGGEHVTIGDFNSQESGTPVIGYKQADISRLRLPKNGREASIEFRGVAGGVNYGINSEQEGDHGFHMFASLDAARSHWQEGDVILEVLGHGEVIATEDGYVTSKQRVLQVLLDTCGLCEQRQATCVEKIERGEYMALCKHCKDNGGANSVSLAKLANCEDPNLPVFAPVTATKNVGAFVPTALEG